MTQQQGPITVVRDARGVVTLTLNRPERHNALSAALIEAMDGSLRELAVDPAVRVIVITGAGPTFCSGADLEEMRNAGRATLEENEREAARLATLLDVLDRLPRPTVARVQGNGFGGALGLISACDVVIAAEHAKFALTEVRLGLIPAMISPYVIRAIGQRNARRLFLTAESFDGRAAAEYGLAHVAVPAAELDARVEATVKSLLTGAPGAQAEAKRLIRHVSGRDEAADLAAREETTRWIARLRAGEEGLEGLNSFLEKRKPRWSA